MSTNCFVKKLNAVVDNDNLPIVGKLRIKSLGYKPNDQSNEQIRFRIWVDAPTTIENVNGENTIVLSNNQSTNVYTQNSGEMAVLLKAGDYTLTNYHITSVKTVSYYNGGESGERIQFNIDDLKYDDITDFQFHGESLYGDLKSFAGKTLRNLAFYRPGYSLGLCEVTGTTEDIANITFSNENGASLTLPKNITGDISLITGSFAVFTTNTNGLFGSINSIIDQSPKLSYISVANNPRITGVLDNVTCPLTTIAIGGSSVNIELTKFAASQVAAGRVTGTLFNGYWWGSRALFNGEGFGTGSDTIKWRPTTSSITNGVTDLMSTLKNVAIVIDADGNKVGDTTTW